MSKRAQADPKIVKSAHSSSFPIVLIARLVVEKHQEAAVGGPILPVDWSAPESSNTRHSGVDRSWRVVHSQPQHMPLGCDLIFRRSCCCPRPPHGYLSRR